MWMRELDGHIRIAVGAMLNVFHLRISLLACERRAFLFFDLWLMSMDCVAHLPVPFRLQAILAEPPFFPMSWNLKLPFLHSEGLNILRRSKRFVLCALPITMSSLERAMLGFQGSMRGAFPCLAFEQLGLS